MTQRARNYVLNQLDESSSNAVLLDVTESGCNGFMYQLSYVPEQPSNTRKFNVGDGLSVYVQNSSWNLVRGTCIDLIKEGLNSSIQFQNPNAETLCGCGESFSVRGT